MKISLKDLVLFGQDFWESYPCLLENFAKAFGNDEVELNAQTLRTFMNMSDMSVGKILEEIEGDAFYDIDEDEFAESLGLTFCKRCYNDYNIIEEILDKLENMPITESAPTIVLLIEKWLDMQ